MSSLLQKNHSTKENVLEQEQSEDNELFPCPECGKMTIKRIKSDCTLRDGTFVPNLEFYYCSTCHAKLYDDAAMQKIEIFREKMQ
jgi:predicted RNA-binding Zn-ribbon protein involved in translation (DUF1610 family)